MSNKLLQHELVRPFAPYILGIWDHRVWAVGTACVISLIIWTVVMLLPSQYDGKAKVFVDTDSLLRPLLNGLTVNDVTDVQMMSRALKSRPQLEKLVRETDLDVKATTPAAYERLLDSVNERIQVVADRESIYTISYTGSNRDDVLKVTRQLLNNFVEDTVGSGHEDSAQAEQALKREIDDYERRLFEAEERLKSFKQANVGLMPNDVGDYYTQLQEALDSLSEGEKALRATLRRVDALRAQLDGEEPSFGMVSNLGMSNLRTSRLDPQIKALQSKLSDLLIEYTEKHPEVVRTKGLLDDLNRQRMEEHASQPIPINPSTGSLDINPIYQSLRIQLNDSEVESVALKAAVRERRERVAELKKLVDVVPAVESELSRLNRDYEVVTNRYQQMLGRWEDLQTSKRVGNNTDSIQFRFIEPPFSPLEPSGPPRPIFIAGGTTLALGVGVAIALLMYLVHPGISLPSQLAEKYQLNVIGVVSNIVSPKSLRKMRRQTFFVATGVLMIVGGTATLTLFAEPCARALEHALSLI